MQAPTFASLGCPDTIVDTLAKRDILVPTAVQLASYGPVAAGRSMIVQSRTGSGKTLAFLLPMLSRLREGKQTQALILTPTRELAQQCAEEIRRVSRVKFALLVGGMSYTPQLRALAEGATIVVGTPGRAIDHLERGSLVMSQAHMVVLDECDEMLDMGFLDDVTTLVAATQPERQTLLFSATLPPQLKRLAERFAPDCDHVRLVDANEHAGHADITHRPVCLQTDEQIRGLINMVLHDDPSAALIFCNTKALCEIVTEQLQQAGISSAFLHGDLAQNSRTQVLNSFRRGKITCLVATDVAARGLDVRGLPLVVHLGLPPQLEDYIHRSGRTGRAGEKGTSTALCGPRDARILQSWARKGGITLDWRDVPQPTAIKAAQEVRLQAALAEAESDGELLLAERMLASTEPLALVSSLLGILLRDRAQGFDLKNLPPPRTDGRNDYQDNRRGGGGGGGRRFDNDDRGRGGRPFRGGPPARRDNDAGRPPFVAGGAPRGPIHPVAARTERPPAMAARPADDGAAGRGFHDRPRERNGSREGARPGARATLHKGDQAAAAGGRWFPSRPE